MLAQNTISDSLLQIINTETSDSLRLSATLQLIASYTKDEEQVEELAKRAEKEFVHNEIHTLKLLYAKQIFYCTKIDNEKCAANFQSTLELAKALKSTNYQVLTRLNRLNALRSLGIKEGRAELLDSVKQLVEKYDDPSLSLKYYNDKALQTRINGQPREALKYAHKALEAAIEADEKNQFIGIYISQGRIYKQIGEIDSAEIVYLKALKTAKAREQKYSLPSIYNNLGNISHVKGKYDDAIAYYMESVKLKEAIDDKRGLSIGYHNIGAIKFDLKDYEGAREMFLRSNEMAVSEAGNRIQVANALKIAKSYQEEGENAKALKFNNQSYELSQKLNYGKGKISALIAIGNNNTELGNYSEAIKSLQQGHDLAKSAGYKPQVSEALVSIAQWYLKQDQNQLSSDYQVSTKKIESLLLEAKGLSEDMDYGEQRLNVYSSLQKFYQHTKASSKEAVISRELLNLKDSLFSEGRSKAIAEWETKYTTAEKEKEIIALEAENKISHFKTRLWQWLLLGLFVLFVVFSYLAYNYLKQRNIRQRMKEAENFRTKISSDLHDDVGSILASVAMQSEILGLNASEDKKSKFDNLSNLTRQAMSRMRDTVWAIDARKDNVQSLIYRMLDHLSTTLEDHSLNYDFDFNEEQFSQPIEPKLRQALYLIFKEALTNATKHSNGDLIKIYLRIRQDNFILKISDNGSVNTDELKQISGLGLENMKMRAKKVNASFELDTSDGFSILISTS